MAMCFMSNELGDRDRLIQKLEKKVLDLEREVTERKQAQETLQESEEMYKTLVENSPIGVYYSDFKGTFLYGNKKAEKIIGYNREELVGKSYINLKLIDGKGIAKAIKLLALNALGKATGPDGFVLNRKDGSKRLTEIYTTIITIKGKKVVMGLVEDVTDRKRIEKALLESQTNLQTLFDSLDDFLFVLDAKGRIVEVNPIVLQRLGYSRTELLGENVLKVHPLERHREATGTLADIIAGKTDLCSIPLAAKDGTLIPVETKVTRGCWDDRNVLFGIYRDITERIALQKRLVLSERLAVLGQVASGVAHEINTPLSNISLMADNLKNECPDPIAQNFADKTLQQVRFAARIVRELLDFARPGCHDFQPVDLNRVIDLALEQLDIPDWITTKRELVNDLGQIPGDPVKLQEVVTNLLSNAIDAMRDGGSGTLTIATEAVGSTAELTVTDTGEGIKEEHLCQLFVPFFSTKPPGKGTGLGLPLVERFIQAHDGSIDVESNVGKGTSITIKLPGLSPNK